jgi:hypothetical protein
LSSGGGIAEFDAIELTTEFVDLEMMQTNAPISEIDLADVVDEIINRPGWTPGNALGLVIKDNLSDRFSTPSPEGTLMFMGAPIA